MKRNTLTTLILLFLSTICFAQNDSTFCRRLYNAENSIYLEINFNEQNVVVPQQEFMGEMAGYLGDEKDFRKWLIVEAEVKKKTAYLQIINVEGSEDLEAQLIYNGNGNYTLRQGEGSTLKIARNRKWKKLPKELVFTVKP